MEMKFLGPSGMPAHEDSAHRRANRDRLPGGLQLPVASINAEHNHGIRILILREQPPAGRVNREMSRRPPLGGLHFNGGKLARLLIHGKPGDAVVPAV